MPRRNRNVAAPMARLDGAPGRPRARTSAGQHYLVDGGALQRIVDKAALDPDDVVIEIGPGPGPLTKRLLKTGARVVGVEIDERFRPNLEHLQRDADRFAFAWGDVLKMDLETLWGDTPPAHRVLVGNIPYQITSPLIARMSDLRDRFSRAIILMQREVAERLIAEPGSKARSALSAKVQLDFAMQLLFRVGPKSFKPPPRVSSAVVRFEPLAEPPVKTPEERHRVRKVIEAAFGARRQMVVNALARRYGPALPKETWTALLERLEIDPRRRAETLATADFVQLGRLVAEAEKSLDQNR